MPYSLPGSFTPGSLTHDAKLRFLRRFSAPCPSSPQGSTTAFSSTETMAIWKGKLLILAMGMSAVVLLVDRNARAMAQNRPALRDTTELAQRPPAAEPQQVLWVDSQTGNDARADGSEQAPFRTITRALQAAQPNTVIQLAPGTYSTDSGELFPLALKAGVTIQGNPDELGHGTVIRGGGDYSSSSQGRQNVTLVGASQSALMGVTVTNPTVRGHGLWVEAGNPTIRSNTFISSTNAGLFSAGSSAPIVHGNLFVLNRVSGVVVAGYAQPQLVENVFQRTGAGIAVGENAAPQIVGNRISQNRDGIVVQGESQPILRNNTIEDSERDGIVVIAQAQPNLGTAQEPGQNSFYNNRQHDIDALATTQTLPAFGNQLASSRIAGQVDLTGRAPLVSVTTVASAADRLPATRVSRITAVPTFQPISNPAASSTSPTAAPTNPGFTTSHPAQRSLATRTLPKRQPALIASLPPADSTANLMPVSLAPGNLASANLASANLAPVNSPPANRLPSSLQPSSPAPQNPQAAGKIDRLLAELRQMRQTMATASPNRTVSQAPSQSAFSSRQSAQAVARSIAIPVPPPESTRPVSSRTVSSRTASSQTASLQTASSQTASTQTVARAIPIPVPAPESASNTAPDPALNSVVVRAVASLPRQDFSGLSAPVLGGSPISVPAPAAPAVTARPAAPVLVAVANPASASATSAPATSISATSAPASGAARSTRPNNLLPVPSDTIPLGNTGDLPKVSLANLDHAAASSPSLPLQYRVLVAAEDEQAQSLVESLVPEAFAVSLNGQTLMQIGAFSSYDNAQEALTLLSQNGLRGMIQSID